MTDEVQIELTKIKQTKDPIKKARLIKTVIKNHDLRIKEIARQLAMTPSYVCHLLRLTRLSEIIIDGYYSGTVALSHLFVVSRLKNQSSALIAYEKILTNNLTVRQLEEYVREQLYNIQGRGQKLQERVKQALRERYLSIDKNLAVSIVQTRVKARLTLSIKGDPEKTSAVLEKIANYS